MTKICDVKNSILPTTFCNVLKQCGSQNVFSLKVTWMQKKSLLLVDNEEVTRQSITRGLEANNLIVTTTSTGEKALSQLENNQFDLLIADMTLKGINDLEVLKQAKNVYPDIGVIILIDSANSSSALDTLRHGADEYLMKPCDIDDLLFLINRCLAKQNLVAQVREQKDFLQNVLGSLTHPFYVIDAHDFTIKLANKKAGVDHDLEKTTCYALSHGSNEPCDGINHPCPLAEIKKTGKPVVVEHIHHSATGVEQIVEVYAYPIFDHAGNLKQIIEYSLDITARREMEKELRIQDKMSSLGRVAAGIAHEIRNPLSGINIYLDTLKKIIQKKGSNEKMQEILVMAQSASNKIESVIKRVMDFSKPTEPRLVMVEVNKAIDNALDLYAVTLRKKGIALDKSLAADLPHCYLDAQLIEQVVLNLLSNALDALQMVTAEKKIKVSSGRLKDSIFITVADSGPGVPHKLQDKIFDPFFSDKRDSSGIGLSICQRIVTDHGGTMTVETSALGGAEFTITLKLEKRRLPR